MSVKLRYHLCCPNPASYVFPLQSVTPGTTKEKKDKTKDLTKDKTKDKTKKKSSRTVWTVPIEKLWTGRCSTPILPLYNPPPSTPVKGTSISKLKEMNGWK